MALCASSKSYLETTRRYCKPRWTAGGEDEAQANTLASIGHSNAVKLTDLTPLLDEEGDEDAPLGITDLPSDSEDDDEDADDDADAPVEPSNPDSDDPNNDDDDDGNDDDDDEPSPPTKETFFADL